MNEFLKSHYRKQSEPHVASVPCNSPLASVKGLRSGSKKFIHSPHSLQVDAKKLSLPPFRFYDIMKKMSNKQTSRTEKDSLGTVKIPKDAYYGTTTHRALKNFQISGLKAPQIFRESLGIVKLAAAETNTSLGLIKKNHGKALKKACEEFIGGKFENEFVLDVFQAGAGTSYNMNANEVIANRSNEILKAPKGSYKFIHPNNHVNMGQSTNDVIPTATRIAILFSTPELLKAAYALEKAFEEKAKKYAKTVKVGRTHLQDAVPVTFGQTFDAYREALKKSRELIAEASQKLQVLAIGGTALGTGINAHPKYKSQMIKTLTRLTGIKFSSAKNLTEGINNMNDFMNFSSALKSLATDLLNISETFKIMATGPKAGLNEILLPPVQPGSSIMPGKVNPSITEALEMICIQVCGNDKCVEMASQKSQFELNVFCPLIMHNILQSIKILTNGATMFHELCLEKIEINKEEIKKQFENSLCTATELVPKIGYAQTAEIVKAALKNKTTIKEELKKRKL